MLRYTILESAYPQTMDSSTPTRQRPGPTTPPAQSATPTLSLAMPVLNAKSSVDLMLEIMQQPYTAALMTKVIALDCEMKQWERNNSAPKEVVTEIGICELNTSSIGDSMSLPKIIKALEAKHIRIWERSRLITRKDDSSGSALFAAHKFLFGHSAWAYIHEIHAIVMRNLESPGIAPSTIIANSTFRGIRDITAAANARVSSSAAYRRARSPQASPSHRSTPGRAQRPQASWMKGDQVPDLVIVAHAWDNDEEVLKEFDINLLDLEKRGMTIVVIDTQIVGAPFLARSNSALSGLLRYFKIEPQHRHNAGNDAVYTLVLLIVMTLVLAAGKRATPLNDKWDFIHAEEAVLKAIAEDSLTQLREDIAKQEPPPLERDPRCHMCGGRGHAEAECQLLDTCKRCTALGHKDTRCKRCLECGEWKGHFQHCPCFDPDPDTPPALRKTPYRPDQLKERIYQAELCFKCGERGHRASAIDAPCLELAPLTNRQMSAKLLRLGLNVDWNAQKAAETFDREQFKKTASGKILPTPPPTGALRTDILSHGLCFRCGEKGHVANDYAPCRGLLPLTDHQMERKVGKHGLNVPQDFHDRPSSYRGSSYNGSPLGMSQPSTPTAPRHGRSRQRQDYRSTPNQDMADWPALNVSNNESCHPDNPSSYMTGGYRMPLGTPTLEEYGVDPGELHIAADPFGSADLATPAHASRESPTLPYYGLKHPQFHSAVPYNHDSTTQGSLSSLNDGMIQPQAAIYRPPHYYTRTTQPSPLAYSEAISYFPAETPMGAELSAEVHSPSPVQPTQSSITGGTHTNGKPPSTKALSCYPDQGATNGFVR